MQVVNSSGEGLVSTVPLFTRDELQQKIERNSNIMQNEMDNEQQTPLTEATPVNTESPPPLPALDDPVAYVEHSDAIPIFTRRNYIRDRM